jgi:hypothetical protein
VRSKAPSNDSFSKPDWFTSLKHQTYQLAKVTCKEMITHLWTRFGLIDEIDMVENRKQLEIPWDPALPIDTLFARLLYLLLHD